uniref:G-protein coupled receptors family 1 profile domain-containing protein n=1 Tax=Knipowitschia caucasica TaxID=637954 RepID=A0AAV2M0T3_KNICA
MMLPSKFRNVAGSKTDTGMIRGLVYRHFYRSRPSGNAETEAELETRLDSRDTQKGHAGHSRSGPRSSPCTSPERHQDQRGTDETGRKSSVADGRGAAGASQGFTGRQGSRRTPNLRARTIGAHQECGEKASTKITLLPSPLAWVHPASCLTLAADLSSEEELGLQHREHLHKTRIMESHGHNLSINGTPWYIFECTLELNTDYRRIALFLLYLFIFITGLLENLLVLWVNWRRRHSANGVLFCVLNISLSDMMVIVILPFYMLEVTINQVWLWGRFLCKVTSLVYAVNFYSSTFFLALMTLERYLMLTKPTFPALFPAVGRRRWWLCAGPRQYVTLRMFKSNAMCG